MEEITIDTWATIAMAIATVALVFLLWKTIKQFESTAVLAQVQTAYRFRPWIGPVNSIQKSEHSINEKCQFDVGIKNYGEFPATKVVAKFKLATKMLKRDDIHAADIETFDLGPMLPNMEKHYWFFIEQELWKKAEENKEKVFIVLYFEYPTSSGKSGYGMISEYNSSSKNFVHRDMWVDDEKPKELT